MNERVFQIEANSGIGLLKYGMKREEIHRILGEPISAFRKTPHSTNSTDEYSYCHVYYSQDDRFEAIEFFDEVSVMLEKNRIFPGLIEQVQKIIPGLQKTGDSYISKDISVGLYVPNDEGIVEACLCGIGHYYDKF